MKFTRLLVVRNRRFYDALIGITLGILVWLPNTCNAERIKDLASIAGVRDNQLVGYGLVVGLNASGDQTNQTPFTVQSLRSMLKRLGVNVPANQTMQVKNVAAVALSAKLPAFVKPGQTIDVTVSSIGNAKSLKGGTLLMAPLRGVDKKVYAMAQGNVVVGGVGVSTDNGNSVSINIPSVGRIPNGATVEQAVATPFENGGRLILNLHRADFTTAKRMVDAINKQYGGSVASALDGGSVAVSAPVGRSARVGFMADLEQLRLNPGEVAGRVIVNSRTGTVVITQHVRVSAAAISHGNLTVTVTSKPQVSQPGVLSRGNTVTVPGETLSVTEEKKPMFLFEPGVTLDEIVKAVNRVGAAPSDLIAILEALRSAGALHAELIII